MCWGSSSWKRLRNNGRRLSKLNAKLKGFTVKLNAKQCSFTYQGAWKHLCVSYPKQVPFVLFWWRQLAEGWSLNCASCQDGRGEVRTYSTVITLFWHACIFASFRSWTHLNKQFQQPWFWEIFCYGVGTGMIIYRAERKIQAKIKNNKDIVERYFHKRKLKKWKNANEPTAQRNAVGSFEIPKIDTKYSTASQCV